MISPGLTRLARPRTTRALAYLALAWAVLIVTLSVSLPAAASCGCPASDPCPSGCLTCQVVPATCNYMTACTLGDAKCDTGDNETSQSPGNCSPGFVEATCSHSCSRQIAACASCPPGRYGSTCLPCPGGTSTPCMNQGTCNDGISG